MKHRTRQSQSGRFLEIASTKRRSRNDIFFGFVFLLLSPAFSADSFPKEMVVAVPVADIRAQRLAHSFKYEYDDLQETQVLQGERVVVYEKKGAWARVSCPEQMEFTHHNTWEGYPGWIKWKYLSEDTKKYPPLPLATRVDDAVRNQILEFARKHLGEYYFWGGRSLRDPQNKKVLTGVDCSGLVNLSYRQAGLLIPRDAHEQFMKAVKKDPSELKPADLIFLSKKDTPEKITHVMMYTGNGRIIEAPQTGETVREIPLLQRLGKDPKELKNGMEFDGRVVTFGSLLEEKK